ncbi:MAG: hypothetical protein U5L45_26800 [Saprospiraceae bacterium]|nr:hypothetical protein [Saprospiraceae bacterium]
MLASLARKEKRWFIFRLCRKIEPHFPPSRERSERGSRRGSLQKQQRLSFRQPSLYFNNIFTTQK